MGSLVYPEFLSQKSLQKFPFAMAGFLNNGWFHNGSFSWFIVKH
jgi:hypothetical protein